MASDIKVFSGWWDRPRTGRPMTVGELKVALEGFPDEALVYIDGRKSWSIFREPWCSVPYVKISSETHDTEDRNMRDGW